MRLLVMGQPDNLRDGARVLKLVREERRLAERLSGLTPAARAAAAAAAAARLLPNYRLFHEKTGQGEPAALEKALDEVWGWLRHGSAIELPTIAACFNQGWAPAELAAVYLDSGPEAVDSTTYLAESAFCAVSAATGACHAALHDQRQEALVCLRNGRDGAAALSCYQRLASGSAPPVQELNTDDDPLVRREIHRQLFDLKILEDSGPTAEILAKLRAPLEGRQ